MFPLELLPMAELVTHKCVSYYMCSAINRACDSYKKFLSTVVIGYILVYLRVINTYISHDLQKRSVIVSFRTDIPNILQLSRQRNASSVVIVYILWFTFVVHTSY